jgi:hypothetical protein
MIFFTGAGAAVCAETDEPARRNSAEQKMMVRVITEPTFHTVVTLFLPGA